MATKLGHSSRGKQHPPAREATLRSDARVHALLEGSISGVCGAIYPARELSGSRISDASREGDERSAHYGCRARCERPAMRTRVQPRITFTGTASYTGGRRSSRGLSARVPSSSADFSERLIKLLTPSSTGEARTGIVCSARIQLGRRARAQGDVSVAGSKRAAASGRQLVRCGRRGRCYATWVEELRCCCRHTASASERLTCKEAHSKHNLFNMRSLAHNAN